MQHKSFRKSLYDVAPCKATSTSVIAYFIYSIWISKILGGPVIFYKSTGLLDQWIQLYCIL